MIYWHEVMNRRQVNHLVAFFELSIDKKTLNPINKLNAFNYGVYMSASEFKEINKKDRHFLLTCSFPHNGESHFRNFHYVRKNGASLPPA